MLAILPLLLPILQGVIGKVLPDSNQQAAMTAELQRALIESQGEVDKAIAESVKAQLEVNLAEAQSTSGFRGNWRPFVGWVCGFGCAYGFLVHPLAVWAAGIVNALAGSTMPAPPALDMNTLLTLLGGMLGLGTLRTAERIKGVEPPAKGRAK